MNMKMKTIVVLAALPFALAACDDNPALPDGPVRTCDNTPANPCPGDVTVTETD